MKQLKGFDYMLDNNLNFNLEEDIDFTFDLYEGVPTGEHTATITDIAVEKNRPTKFGVKDSITVVFHLEEANRDFRYSFNKSTSTLSKYYTFFKMICTALGVTNINVQNLIGQTFKITIGLEPTLDNPDTLFTKITSIEAFGEEGETDEQQLD